MKDQQFQAQLSQAQKANEAEAERAKKKAEAEITELRAALSAKDKHLQTQLDQAQKAHDVEVERTKQKAEAELADLRATVSRLEVDLVKVSDIRNFGQLARAVQRSVNHGLYIYRPTRPRVWSCRPFVRSMQTY